MQVLVAAAALVAAVALVLVAAGARARSSRHRAEAAALSEAAEAARARLGEEQARAGALAGALDALALGVVVGTAAGDGVGVVFRNRAAEAVMTGGASDALAGRAVSELLDAAVAGRDESRTLDLFGPPRRTLSLSAVPLAPVVGAVVVEDVSDRRRVDVVRRDFVANVSHELKTPVAAVGLLAETLAGEDDPEVVRRLSARMQDEAFRLARIIEELLDLGRLEGEERAYHESFGLDLVVGQAVDQVLPAAARHGVPLVVGELAPGWAVRGDRRQLVSAVVNLLENAVKYSAAGATVEVEARGRDGSVELAVRDEGVGIPSRDLDRVFERFYRVDRGRGRDTGGTGLGLSIVRHVVANHGGEVRVESQEGVGSVFTLRLPAQPVAAGLVAGPG